ncbi:hypothetical protein ACQKM2_01990 [Streptomyces sp. NPDC004126]|uniref:hypothetical protein n=1 Tax=Streptomyces sp. NPDC004126 TaxID=3390695 RepID=UPI003D005309
MTGPESTRALGPGLRAHIATSLADFQAAFARLVNSPGTVLKQPPGSRTDAVWTDVATAGNLTALTSGLANELAREWFASDPSRPWILFVADRSADLLSLCRIEHERAWFGGMFSSVSDHAGYRTLVERYAAQGAALEGRRSRVRNALVHGNPAGFTIVGSVREYAEFLSGGALNIALESYIEGPDRSGYGHSGKAGRPSHRGGHGRA